MSGRPAKTLFELVRDGTFRARRHHPLLASADLPWPGFALLQQRYRACRSEPERRSVALEFERAVGLAHEEADAEDARGSGRSLAAELEQLGRAGTAAHLLAFFPAYLEHPKGPLRGQPFVLESWQRRFVREFYRRDKDGLRVYDRGYLGLPRGNGKTPLAAALALYELVTRTDAPEIYFSAASKDQARVAMSFARSFVELGPLKDWVTVKSSLSCPATSGTMRVLSSEGALAHGLMPAVAILDELWAFETQRQVEAYTAAGSSLHKRENAYLLAITTAGFNKRSLLGEIYEQALRWPQVKTEKDGCLTIAKDEENGLLLWWYGAPIDADPEDRKLWRAVNPGSWITMRSLKRQRHDPGLGELGFRRLNLNQWTAARNAWLPAGTWDELYDDTAIPDRAPVYVGVDVALHQDTTAVAWAWRRDDGLIVVRVKVWAADRDAPAHVHTDGKVQLEVVENFIGDQLARRFDVREVAYDPRFFDRSAELLEKQGLTLVEFLQASATMYDAYQRFYQLAVERKLAHDGDEVFAAHVAATAAVPSERGWKIRRLKNGMVIDATVAACMAVARADLNDGSAKPNIYWMPLE